MTFDDHYYEASCRLLVEAVKAASNRENFYGIDPVGRAVYLARQTMREAQRTGRYPMNHELEREARRAA